MVKTLRRRLRKKSTQRGGIDEDFDAMRPDLPQEGGATLTARDYTYNEIPISQFTAEHDAIHMAAFGTDAPRTMDSTRILSGSAPATLQLGIECRSGGRLIGFFIAEGGADTVVDIWSVCKDTNIASKGVFEFLLEGFLTSNQSVEYVALQVATAATKEMTEAGRLMYYSALGFRILPGNRVSILYPDESGVVVGQADQNRVTVNMMTTDAGVIPIDIYIGYIKSSGDSIVMVGERSVIAMGKQPLAHESFAQTPVVNNFDNAVYPYEGTALLLELHMANIPEAYTDEYGVQATRLKEFKIPDNVSLVQISMPGSVLYGQTTGFSKIIHEIISDGRKYDYFMKKFRGIDKLPIHIPLLTSAEFKRSPNTYENTLLGTATVLQFGRNDVINLCGLDYDADDSNEPAFWGVRQTNAGIVYNSNTYRQSSMGGGASKGGADSGNFQSFLEFRTYAPGMTALDNVLIYSHWDQTNVSYDMLLDNAILKTNIYEVTPVERANIGDNVVSKFYKQTGLRPRSDLFEGFSRDGQYTRSTLSSFVDVVSRKYSGQHVTVFVFGCGGIYGDPTFSEGESLFYELAHRRSFKYVVRSNQAPGNIIPYLVGDAPQPCPLMAECTRETKGIRLDSSLCRPAVAVLPPMPVAATSVRPSSQPTVVFHSAQPASAQPQTSSDVFDVYVFEISPYLYMLRSITEGIVRSFKVRSDGMDVLVNVNTGHSVRGRLGPIESEVSLYGRQNAVPGRLFINSTGGGKRRKTFRKKNRRRTHKK